MAPTPIHHPRPTASHAARDDAAPESIELFFDGKCPLCAREVALLEKLDTRGRIRFTDIAAEDFDPSRYGKDLDTLMAEIHARLPDGGWIRGVEVFRRLYAAVGYKRLVAISRWPVISQALDLGYRLFAKNRLRLTGRCDGTRTACHVRYTEAVPTGPVATPDLSVGRK